MFSIPLLCKSGLVYKVRCSECNEFYVGLTTRQLKQRLTEHASTSTSAIHRHSLVRKHVIDFQNPEVLNTDCIKSRLYIKEALCIKETCAFRSLNGNTGSVELSLWR